MHPSKTFLFPFAMFARASSFQFPTLPNFFKPPTTTGAGSGSGLLEQQKEELLDAVSFTQNGKTASPATQAKVLSIVREIEKAAPPRLLFNDPNEANKLDGVWYLQYTSPSEIEDEEALIETWKPVDPVEYGIVKKESAIETKRFTAKGSVAAAGITVDTSNKVVKQIFNVAKSEVANEINFDWGRLTVSGPFVSSEKVSNRAIVAFKDLQIEFNNGPTLSLGFIFSAIQNIKGSDVGGWLETTYLGDDMRIGRGNKGTMFVLTRDREAVKP